MNLLATQNQTLAVLADQSRDEKKPLHLEGHLAGLSQDRPNQAESSLMLLASRALKEWRKRVSATDAMIVGAGITNAVRSYKDYTALKSSYGLQRLVVVSARRPQFKLVHRSITIPKKMAAKYRIGAGPIRVRLFMKAKGETWTSNELDQSFTAAWPNLPQKYRISLSKEHEVGQRPAWNFWYRPSQSGLKAKKAAMELLGSLDDFVNANIAISSIDSMMNYMKQQY